MELENLVNKKFILKGSIIVAILAILYLLNKLNYLLFHSFIELFTVVIAFAFFSITWNSKKYIQNGFILFIGISYFFIAFIDLLHTLSYQGLHIFNNYDYATQFWISGRAMESITILIGFHYLYRKKQPSVYRIFTIYTMVTALIVYFILVEEIFPPAYIDGYGLTTFKIVSEYVIITFLILSLVFLQYFSTQFEKNIYYLLLVSLVLTIFSELAFTIYVDAYDIFNFIGHSLKFLSFYFVYSAIIETGIRRPFGSLFFEIKTHEKQLMESNAMKDKFLSVLAHDLRGTMSGLFNMSKLMYEQFEDLDVKTKKDLLHELESSSKHGIDLLNDLLVWGKSQTGRIQYEPVPVAPIKAFQESTLFFNTDIVNKNLQVNNTIDPYEKVMADQNMLQTIARNLLSNAIKFSHKGGIIVLSSTLLNNMMTIAVSDNGIGIPPSDHQNIFRLDKQLSRNGTNNEKGTGLGLLLCKDFVEINKGSIWFDSAENKGSTFYISLPVANNVK